MLSPLGKPLFNGHIGSGHILDELPSPELHGAFHGFRCADHHARIEVIDIGVHPVSTNANPRTSQLEELAVFIPHFLAKHG